MREALILAALFISCRASTDRSATREDSQVVRIQQIDAASVELTAQQYATAHGIDLSDNRAIHRKAENLTNAEDKITEAQKVLTVAQRRLGSAKARYDARPSQTTAAELSKAKQAVVTAKETVMRLAPQWKERLPSKECQESEDPLCGL